MDRSARRQIFYPRRHTFCRAHSDTVLQDQPLTYSALRATAEAAFSGSSLTQTSLADSLGVTQGAISRALREEGASRAALQSRIIAELTEFEIVEVGGFVMKRKD